jgi:hypothetical protein
MIFFPREPPLLLHREIGAGSQYTKQKTVPLQCKVCRCTPRPAITAGCRHPITSCPQRRTELFRGMCVWHLHHCTHRLSSKERRVHDESHHGGMAAGCRACVPHGMMMMGRVSISFLHGACESFLPSHRSAVPSPDHTTRKRTGTCFFAMLSWMRLAQRQRCAAM